MIRPLLLLLPLLLGVALLSTATSTSAQPPAAPESDESVLGRAAKVADEQSDVARKLVALLQRRRAKFDFTQPIRANSVEQRAIDALRDVGRHYIDCAPELLEWFPAKQMEPDKIVHPVAVRPAARVIHACGVRALPLLAKYLSKCEDDDDCAVALSAIEGTLGGREVATLYLKDLLARNQVRADRAKELTKKYVAGGCWPTWEPFDVRKEK